jgi:hypothetical protein
LTVAQVLDVIDATRSGSSAKKRHAAQDLSTMVEPFAYLKDVLESCPAAIQ